MKPSNKLDAYLNIISDGTMLSDKSRIVEVLKQAPQTLKTLCEKLRKKDHQISGRLSQLNDEGVIKSTYDPLNRHSVYSIVEDEEEAAIIRHARFTEKKLAWLNTGKIMGFIDSDNTVTI